MVKDTLLFIHRWLGLVTGLVVVVVSITGAIFVFEEELFRAFHPSITKVKPQARLVDINILQRAAQKAIGEEKVINTVFIYGEADRAYYFSAFKRNPKSETIWDKDELEYFYQVYVNQYTGEVMGVVDKESEFFYTVRRIHQNLLLRHDIGNMIVGWSVAIFVFILLTGIVLWWPSRLAKMKQSFSIKWKARWKRLNYDLHNVLGFYSFIFALIIALTGLVWSFKWFEDSVFKMFGTSKKEAKYLAQRDTTYNASSQGVTLAWRDVLSRYDTKTLEKLNISFPTKKNSRISVFVAHTGPSLWKNVSYYYYHGNTGQLQEEVRHGDKSAGMKWRNSNYDLHTGKIYGWPTQLLAVIVSLICASLPITGFVMWLKRGKPSKNRKPASKAKGEFVRTNKVRPSVRRTVVAEEGRK